MEIGIKTPKSNYGIKLLQEALNLMNHRLEVISFMQPLKYIPEVKEILLNKDKLREFIEHNFTNNTHFVVIKQVTEEQKE